jgi:hypothetical protein
MPRIAGSGIQQLLRNTTMARSRKTAPVKPPLDPREDPAELADLLALTNEENDLLTYLEFNDPELFNHLIKKISHISGRAMVLELARTPVQTPVNTSRWLLRLYLYGIREGVRAKTAAVEAEPQHQDADTTRT